MKNRVLIYESETETADAFCNLLSNLGAEPILGNVRNVIEEIGKCEPNLILFDDWLLKPHHVDRPFNLRDGSRHIPIVITTKFDFSLEEASQLGCSEVFFLPFSQHEFERMVSRYI